MTTIVCPESSGSCRMGAVIVAALMNPPGIRDQEPSPSRRGDSVRRGRSLRQLFARLLRHHVCGVPVWPVRIALSGALLVLTVGYPRTPKCARKIASRCKARRCGSMRPGSRGEFLEQPAVPSATAKPGEGAIAAMLGIRTVDPDPSKQVGLIFTSRTESPANPSGTPNAAPAESTTPTTSHPAINSLPGTDSSGFIDYPGARCDPGNQPAIMARTTLSACLWCVNSVREATTIARCVSATTRASNWPTRYVHPRMTESSDTSDTPAKPQDYAGLRAELATLVDDFTPSSPSCGLASKTTSTGGNCTATGWRRDTTN